MFSRRGTAAAIVLILGSVSPFSRAQGRFQLGEYSAKFLCGVVEEKEPGTAPARPGAYETSINIHNSQIRSSVTFVKKVVLAPRFRRDILRPDFAEHVDCKIIRSMLGPVGGAAFVEGFVVLIVLPSQGVVPTGLDVVGVYTVSNREGQNTDLEMLTVAPRLLTFPAAEGAKLRDQMLEESKKE
jgi:hypothetical protein